MTGMPAVVTTSVLATLAVSLWTLRVALTARNRRVLAAVTVSVEATIFALAFSRLLTSLDSASQVIAYAIGVGIGTLIGLTINERLTPTTDSALRGTSLKPRRRGVTPTHSEPCCRRIPYSSNVGSTERALPWAIAWRYSAGSSWLRTIGSTTTP